MQYESGAFSGSDFSNFFFFLPSTTDRVEDINQYKGSANLSPTDIDISDFGQNFNPSKLDYDNPERQGIKESVLNILRKIVDLCRTSDVTLMVLLQEKTTIIILCCNLVVNEYRMIDLRYLTRFL